MKQAELTNGEKRLLRAALMNTGQGRHFHLLALLGSALIVTSGVMLMLDEPSLASFSKGLLLIGYNLLLYGHFRLKSDAHSLVRRLYSSPSVDTQAGAGNRAASNPPVPAQHYQIGKRGN